MPKLTLYHGNVIEALSRIPDNSVDIIATSPPYFNARDYSIISCVVSTISEDDCISQANAQIESLRNKYPNDDFSLGVILHRNKGYDASKQMEMPERWIVDVHINISAFWGGDKNCNHDFATISEDDCISQANNNGQGSKTMSVSKANNNNMPIISQLCEKCGGWRGNLGNEPNVMMYIEHLMLVTEQLKRVLKPTGYMMWNIGDTYGGNMGKMQGWGNKWEPVQYGVPRHNRGGRQKSLFLVPHRFAIGLDEQEWYIRNDIKWVKPNATPESVMDRYACRYEHVVFATKSKRYYFDLDAIREPYSDATTKRITQPTLHKQTGGEKQTVLREEKSSPNDNGRSMDMVNSLASKFTKHELATRRMGNVSYSDPLHRKSWEDEQRTRLNYNTKYGELNDNSPGGLSSINRNNMSRREQARKDAVMMFPNDVKAQKEYIAYMHDHGNNAIGKNPGDVWTISTSSYKGAHTAVYPKELVSRMLMPGPREVCTICGKPKALTSFKAGISEEDIPKSWGAIDGDYEGKSVKDYNNGAQTPSDIKRRIIQNAQTPVQKVIWKGCDHNSYKAATVLDPFLGSGTTFIMAQYLKLNAIGIDVNGTYIEQIKKRTSWGDGFDMVYEIVEVQ
jgi:hypothetical protein